MGHIKLIYSLCVCLETTETSVNMGLLDITEHQPKRDFVPVRRPGILYPILYTIPAGIVGILQDFEHPWLINLHCLVGSRCMVGTRFC